jgi:hypothetical protein
MIGSAPRKGGSKNTEGSLCPSGFDIKISKGGDCPQRFGSSVSKGESRPYGFHIRVRAFRDGPTAIEATPSGRADGSDLPSASVGNRKWLPVHKHRTSRPRPAAGSRFYDAPRMNTDLQPAALRMGPPGDRGAVPEAGGRSIRSWARTEKSWAGYRDRVLTPQLPCLPPVVDDLDDRSPASHCWNASLSTSPSKVDDSTGTAGRS